MSDNFGAPEGHGAPGGGGAPGGDGAPGHFTNETDRHTHGLFLYDQRHPYNGPERQTVAVPVNTVFGQARLVEFDRQDVDVDTEGDGSTSMQYINIQQPASSSDQQEQNSHPVAPIAFPEVPVPAVQDNRPHMGMTGVQVQNPNLPDSTRNNFNHHAQSLSGFSTLGINQIAQQIQELPPDDNSTVQQLLNRQQGATGNVPRQVSDPTISAAIAYPPIQQNRPQQNVRAECTVDFSPDGEREEERLPAGVSRSTSNDGSQYRTSSSASTVYRTAAWAGASQGGGDVDSHSANMNRFGAAAQRRVCHPRYSSSEARFSSFHRMTVELAQTVKSLTEAGLFFTGYKDTCRCFYCDGELHSWKPEDDPWLEHARHYPNCGHVKQKKGQEYIDLVKFAFSPSQEETEVKACNPDFPGREAIIRTLEEMGFDRDKILKALKGGSTTVSIERLTEIILEQDEVESVQSSNERRNQSSFGFKKVDGSICGACKQRIISITQFECRHIVCNACAPQRLGGLCKICKKKVVDYAAYDPN